MSDETNNDRPRRDDSRGPRKGSPHSRNTNRSKPRRNEDRPSRRDGDFKPRRSGEFKPRRDSDSRPRSDGEFNPRRDGDFKPRRDGGSPPRRDGDSYKPRREGDRRPKRDGDFTPRRDGDYKPRRDGDFAPRGGRSTDRNSDRGAYGRGGTRGAGRSDRGGAGREYTEAERLQHSLRPVRDKHDDPFIPDEVTAKDLNPGARNELKTLDKELADKVARHLAMVGMLIESDPELAYQHAISAMRRAGRIPVTRETYAVTAYTIGDYATALRELRTYRRLSGKDLQLALMIDCERALGRPEKAVETGRSVDWSKLPADVRVQVAIAMSGARLDLGQTQQALYELEIPQLDPDVAYPWSPELFAAYANVLEDLDRTTEAETWRRRAFAAEEALIEHAGGDVLEVIEIEEEPEPEESDGGTVQ